MAADPRITNSDGGSFDAATGRKVLANSRGFVGSYRTSYAGCRLLRWRWTRTARCSAMAGGRARGASRFSNRLRPWGQRQRGGRVRRLGARRVATQQVPIVFAPEVARSLIGSVFEAASGDAIWRHASYLAGKLGEDDCRGRT